MNVEWLTLGGYAAHSLVLQVSALSEVLGGKGMGCKGRLKLTGAGRSAY